MLQFKSLKEFREFCFNNTDAFDKKWNNRKFKITCQKCGSNKTGIIFQGKDEACGSEYTGRWTTKEEGLLVKCFKCGNAMILGEIDSITLDRLGEF